MCEKFVELIILVYWRKNFKKIASDTEGGSSILWEISLVGCN